MPLMWPSGPEEAQCDHGWTLLGAVPPSFLKGPGAGHEHGVEALNILFGDPLDFLPDCIALET